MTERVGDNNTDLCTQEDRFAIVMMYAVIEMEQVRNDHEKPHVSSQEASATSSFFRRGSCLAVCI